MTGCQLARLAWPPLAYTEGCAGGEPFSVFVGYVSNASLGKVFGVSASQIRKLYLSRFEEI